MKKLMIATPAQNGLVSIDYLLSFAATMRHLDRLEIPTSLFIRQSGSLLIAERNTIINGFKNSDATHLLMIDADIGWLPDQVIRLLSANLDIVGATYPSRQNHSYLFRYLGDIERKPESNGLLPVKALPGGFVMVSKEAVNKMCEMHPERYFQSLDGKDEGYDLYSTHVSGREFWGEDFSFCLLAHKCGIPVWLDTKIQLAHAGIVAPNLYDLLTQKDKVCP